MDKNDDFFEYKIKYSFYLVTLSFSIIKMVLSYTDKGYFDAALVLDYIFSILFILSITISLLYRKLIEVGPDFMIFYISNYILMVSVSIIHFFIYNHSKNEDFKNISLFLVIARIVSTIIYNTFYFATTRGY